MEVNVNFFDQLPPDCFQSVLLNLGSCDIACVAQVSRIGRRYVQWIPKVLESEINKEIVILAERVFKISSKQKYFIRKFEQCLSEEFQIEEEKGDDGLKTRFLNKREVSGFDRKSRITIQNYDSIRDRIGEILKQILLKVKGLDEKGVANVPLSMLRGLIRPALEFRREIFSRISDLERLNEYELSNALENLVWSSTPSNMDFAISVAEMISDESIKSKCLIRIVEFFVYRRIRNTERALEIAKMIPSTATKILALQGIVEALLVSGEIKRAIEITEGFKEGNIKSSCLESIVIFFSSNGGINRAQEMAKRISDTVIVI